MRFACDRLVAWYKAGADVQALLPKLATYLATSSLDSTQIYSDNDAGTSAGKRAAALNGTSRMEALMNDTVLLAPWIRRFLLEHLVGGAQSVAEHAAKLPGHPCLADAICLQSTEETVDQRSRPPT